jgi:hypothetical protein
MVAITRSHEAGKGRWVKENTATTLDSFSSAIHTVYYYDIVSAIELCELPPGWRTLKKSSCLNGYRQLLQNIFKYLNGMDIHKNE